jgi:hypothetical protein
LLTDYSFRQKLLKNSKNPTALQYFRTYETWTKGMKAFWQESTLNKINAFLIDNRIRQILCSPKSTFSLKDILDNKKVLLVKLNRARLPGASDLLASLLMTKIKLCAFARESQKKEESTFLFIY